MQAWLFHVDFVTPANSTLGIGTDHSPNALITVNTFVEGFTNTAGFSLVPQQGTGRKARYLGDKIMTPVVYQNLNGTESLWADQTIIPNFPNGPTAVRWYQFDVTGGTFPAAAVQQQDWTNGGDGLWRFMPSIAVDQNGNTAIGYAISSPVIPRVFVMRGVLRPIRQVTWVKAKPSCSTAPAQQTGQPLGRLQHDHYRSRPMA